MRRRTTIVLQKCWLVGLFLVAFINHASAQTPTVRSRKTINPSAEHVQEALRKTGEVVLTFGGDCTFGSVNGDGDDNRFPAVYKRAKRKNYPFALLLPWLINDDLTVVNFECTLTNATKEANKQWHFKGDGAYAQIFPASSVEVVGLSNNHSMDYLQKGFDDTLANLKRAGVPTFYQNHPFVTTLKGIQTVIIGDCTVAGENTTVIGDAPKCVLRQIKKYKRPDNIVVVVMHWGRELETTPDAWQREIGHQFLDAGADAVVGHHPHVVQGIEKYHGKYIAYSLGNLAFGGNSMARNPECFLFRLRFARRGSKTTQTGGEIVPCYISSRNRPRGARAMVNNYQPRPVFGEEAKKTLGLILSRSRQIPHGIRTVNELSRPLQRQP